MTGETDAFLLSGKDIMGVFDEVKERVTARAVMERAGIVFNRGNMCKCPFHQDKTASMKVKPMDKKYFCFGCGEKGDAIDFVAKYYNLSPKDAAIQIADEFGIAYDSSVRSPPKPVRREKSPMQILEEAKTKTYRVLSDYFHLLKEWERDFKPKSIDEIDARYEEAVQNLPMDTLPLDRTGNRRFMPVMVYPERAECHILDNEASTREYIEQVMEIFRSGGFRLMLGKESAEYLKDYQKQFMPEDADAGMILAFLDDFKGDRVCSKLLWKEALHRDYEPKRIELKQICDIMNNSVTDWVMSDGAMHFGDYGKQRGWVRVGSSQEIPDKADSDGFMEIPKQLELEIPFK